MYDVGEPGTQANFVHKRLIGAVVGGVKGFVGGGFTGAISGAGRGFIGTGGGATMPPPTTRAPVFTGLERGAGLGEPRTLSRIPVSRRLAAPTGCSPGFERNPRTGQCETTGFRGRVQRALPFGETGTMEDEFGEAVIGAFNMPALVPAQVGTIMRRDGSVGPILRCPRGSVLATDNLCYNKGIKGLASHRKWKPGRRPFLPARDLRALDRVAALKGNKVLKGRIKALGLC